MEERTGIREGTNANEEATKQSAQERALATGETVLEVSEKGDVREIYPSRERRGEAILEKALERGRELRDNAMEKATPLLASLRSRIGNYATRALKTVKETLGYGAELKDRATDTVAAAQEIRGKVRAAKDVAKNTMREAGEVGVGIVAGATAELGRAAGRKVVAGAEMLGNAVDSATTSTAEKEKQYLEIGMIAGRALSQMLRKEVTLSRAQALALGAAIDAHGLASKFVARAVAGANEVGYEVFGQDMIETARGDAQGLKALYDTFADKNDRNWLVNELQKISRDVADGMLVVAKDVTAPAGKAAKKAMDLGVKGLDAVGRKGVELSDAVEADVTERINLAVAGAKKDWARIEPKVLDGIAATVAPAIELAANLLDAPADLLKEGRRAKAEAAQQLQAGVIEMNRIGKEAVTFSERMQRRFAEAMNIAKRAWNEMRLAMINEKQMAENPQMVQRVEQLVEAIENIDELPVVSAEELAQPPLRRERPVRTKSATPRIGGVTG